MDSVYDFMKSKKVWMLAGLALVAIVLVVIFSGKSDRLVDRSEPVEAVEDLSSTAMRPVVVDEYTYKFEGIKWEFPVEESGTRVNFMLENFSRIEGAYVTFGNPYKLGFYDGECREIESLTYDKEKNPGIPLAYAECIAPGLAQHFVLFQQGEEVVAKIRRSYREIEGYEEPEFITLYTVNLTEIIK